MRGIRFYRYVVVMLCFFFIPLGLVAHGAESVQLAQKYKKYEQFIIIDKSMNKLFFYEGGKLSKSFRVASGRKPSYTPEGLFSIHEKVKNRPYYKEKIKGGDPRNPLGDRWLGLEVTRNGKTSYAYGIHGNNNEKSIGKHVSNGCIRLHNKEIRWLYDQIKSGTLVLIQK